jgi:hypothetical protein
MTGELTVLCDQHRRPASSGLQVDGHVRVLLCEGHQISLDELSAMKKSSSVTEVTACAWHGDGGHPG